MTDFVEIPDDNSSDNEVQDDHGIAVAAPKTNSHSQFNELKTLKSEMEFRSSLLNKTWSELSGIMTRYQAQLVQKHDELDSSLTGGDHFRISQCEDEVKKYKLENQRLRKQVADMESKLLNKDSEIVKLRTEVHKFRTELQIKENLIQKIQSQMAQEALDYQTEITSLKDMLEQGDICAPVPMPSPAPKRRKVVPPPQIHHPTPVRVTPNKSNQSFQQPSPSRDVPGQSTASPVKSESFQSSCAMSDPATSQSGEQMDSVYDNADESFDQSQDGSQEHQFFKVDEVYDESNSGVEGLMLQGEDAQMMLQNTSQEQILESTDPLSLDKIVSNSSQRHLCTVCGKPFRSAIDLKRHHRIHTGLKPYECMLCFMKSATKGNIKTHLNNVHKLTGDACKALIRHTGGPE